MKQVFFLSSFRKFWTASAATLRRRLRRAFFFKLQLCSLDQAPAASRLFWKEKGAVGIGRGTEKNKRERERERRERKSFFFS